MKDRIFDILFFSYIFWHVENMFKHSSTLIPYDIFINFLEKTPKMWVKILVDKIIRTKTITVNTNRQNYNYFHTKLTKICCLNSEISL